jgi:hypothetical protein
VWGTALSKLKALFPTHACKEFNQSLPAFDFRWGYTFLQLHAAACSHSSCFHCMLQARTKLRHDARTELRGGISALNAAAAEVAWGCFLSITGRTSCRSCKTSQMPSRQQQAGRFGQWQA